jgi:CheY-like chemotaxis protein
VPKILVADDNTNIQKMVSLAFEERGIDVIAVGNGETAVRKMPDANPDLVLADVFMPVRNGYEVCEFVKKDSRFAHIPVILLVGAFDPLDEKEARRVGADGVLKKPFVPPDPLIAMVMSALEKNPRVAAELAKAKEQPKEEPLPPALEIATKKEPAPLPDFPEPTAEEAAQIYGFGKGVRATDDDTEEEEETEKKSRAAKAPKAAKPAAAKHDEAEDEDEEGFDPSATRRDKWRSGLDLEIPADVASQPAFSTEQDFGAITFPSEKDVPPKRVRVPETPEQVEFVNAESQADASVSLEEQPSAIAVASAPAAQNLSESAPEAAVVEAPAAATSVAEPKSESVFGWSSSPAPATVSAPQSEAPGSSVAAPAADTETSAAPARASHWMDMMSPEPPVEYRTGSWLTALAPKAQSEAPAAVPAATDAGPGAAAAAQPPAVTEIAAAPASEAASAIPASAPAQIESAHDATHEEHEPIVTASTEDRFFADDSSRGESSYHFGSSEYDAHSGFEEEAIAPIVAETPGEQPSAFASGDAGITEPDPFFADEQSTVPTDYFDHGSGAGPAPSDLSEPLSEPEPQPEIQAASELEAQPEPQTEPLFTASEAASSIFASPAAPASERIPTAPPESREALAGIPFLMPPPEAISSNGGSSHSDANTVDAAVERVLEKLGPQLQEMLTQGLLKPIVEQLLQQELEKKGR